MQQLLRDTGIGYWADTALELAGLVVAEESPARAAVLLRVSQKVRGEHNDVGADFTGTSERLDHCRTQLVERLGAAGWEAALHDADGMTVRDAIEAALASLEPRSA